ncbi:uncharacterized protein LOC144104050 isoform X2 [Amblyomma americanum]
MPTAAAHYTLVGFSPELDWRRLSFVKPIPTNRVCSACGLVRKRAALLSCMHVLCDSCYEQCDQEGSHVCPLDGHEWLDEDDVEWREFPLEQLLKREVKCWNAEQGCQHVAAASMITHHFQRECVHHSTCCPKCSVRVLCREVCAHLRSGTCGSWTDASSESKEGRGLTDENASFAAFNQAFEKKADEMKGYLETITADINRHGETMNEMSHDINTFKEALKKELVTAVLNPEKLKETLFELLASNVEIRNGLSTRIDAVNNLSAVMNRLEKVLTDKLGNVTAETADNIAKITAALEQARTDGRESRHKTLECLNKAHTLAQLQAVQCEFFVQGVKSLQEKALKEGFACYYNERVYLRGYCISPGLYFKKRLDSVTVHVLLQMHKGDMDEVVLWPFEQKIKLRVVHPKKRAEREVEVKTNRSEEVCQKPETSSNRGAYIVESAFALADLLNGGFVEDGKLRVKWELLH